MSAAEPTPPEVLWTPLPEEAASSAIAQFARWVGEHRGVDLDPTGYRRLHAWSVEDLSGFWSAAAEFLGVRFREAPTAVLGSSAMPGAQWFPGATLNYAEHALAPEFGDDRIAVLFAREDGFERRMTYGELREEVARVRAGLVRAGVRRGDRVVALAPNTPEVLVAFLATASLGAVWSSCSPDFGARAVRDRFTQIAPTLLLAVDGYTYGGRRFDIRSTVRDLQVHLPTLRATVLVPHLDPEAVADGTVAWSEFTADRGPLEFDAVLFDHPLWVLYSSGTTGLPKGIVHGHGGMVLEHLKTLRLHHDLGPGDRFLWFTTTGWMMWNFLVGGLLVGSTVVLFDGNPGHPDLGALWRLVERHEVTYFGTSAPFLQACLKAGIRPGDEYDLSRLRAIGSTGAPLSVDGFRWIGDAVGDRVQICSVSGGTDLCTTIVGAAPTVPVWLGEISCALLGAAVVAYDEVGEEVVDQVGELVITRPMPCMPVAFWDDPTGDRLRAAYFEDFPGVWRHGDWVRQTARRSYVIYGRSDSTLNRGGVRMGTADFYAVVESIDDVVDSLVIDTSGPGSAEEGELLCFLVLAPGATLAELEPRLRRELRTALSPRHVPDRFVVVNAVPRTLNGKKCEVPVKRILAGVAAEVAVSRDALQAPNALDEFVRLAAARPQV